MNNRMFNATNPNQGDQKKVLCVCSAGLLRSPTMAKVLSGPPWYYNTRSAGATQDFALIPVDEVLVHWADEIVVAERWMADQITSKYADYIIHQDIVVLDLPDQYQYNDRALVETIHQRYQERKSKDYE